MRNRAICDTKFSGEKKLGRGIIWMLKQHHAVVKKSTKINGVKTLKTLYTAMNSIV